MSCICGLNLRKTGKKEGREGGKEKEREKIGDRQEQEERDRAKK